MSASQVLPPLQRAFARDHKIFIQGLKHTLEALRRGADAEARRLADELDQAVGAHLEFEEEVFYPTLRAALGDDWVGQLYDEHDAGQRAVAELLEQPERPRLAPAVRARLIAGLETALEHALSCGTLVSRLRTVGADEQEQMLERYREIARRARRWTALTSPRAVA